MNLKKAYVFAVTALFTAGGLASSAYAWGGFSAGLDQASGANVVQGEELLWLTNQSRIARGLLPLMVDSKLMRIAQERAEEMAQQGFINHDLQSGNISTRMIRAGYNYETARENLARSQVVSSAHSSLLKSPDHEANILATDVSHIGIGIAKGDSARHGNYLYVVEVFASPRNDYEPSQVKELLTARIEELRSENRLSAKRDFNFEKIAAGSLGGLGDSYTREDLRKLLAKSVDELIADGNSNIARLDISVQRLNSLDKLSIPDTIRRGLAATYGSAVRLVMDKNSRPAFLVLTLVGIPR